MAGEVAERGKAEARRQRKMRAREGRIHRRPCPIHSRPGSVRIGGHAGWLLGTLSIDISWLCARPRSTTKPNIRIARRSRSLLQAIADESTSGIAVQHEPKRVAEKGAPDFKVSKGGLILGYVENKAIGENLNKVLKSDQIAKYKSLSRTSFSPTTCISFGSTNTAVQRETLCHATDLENRKFRLREDRVAAVAKLLQGFFSTAPEGIGRSQQLALALATRSKLLRDYLGEELVRQEREHKEGRLYGLFQIFRDQVFHELTLNEFADAFAQMLAYGLFLARLNSDSNPITLHNAREYVPGSFRLIRELVDFLTELEKAEYRDVRWVVEEVLSIVNALNLPAIHEDLSFRHRKAISRKVRAADEEEHRLFERDPFIYFYEDYLKAYDAAMRKGRGVYYTPPPIVNFIVRAVDDILKESFGIPRWPRRQQARDRARLCLRHRHVPAGGVPAHLRQYRRAGCRARRPDRARPLLEEHLRLRIPDCALYDRAPEAVAISQGPEPSAERATSAFRFS